MHLEQYSSKLLKLQQRLREKLLRFYDNDIKYKIFFWLIKSNPSFLFYCWNRSLIVQALK